VPRSQRVEHSLYGPRPLTLGECARASRLWWEARVFYGFKLVQIRTPEKPALWSECVLLVGRENEAEELDTLTLGVQWTDPGAKAVSELSDVGHI
jgi:hypothetical protein